jgi:hypothetical protein
MFSTMQLLLFLFATSYCCIRGASAQWQVYNMAQFGVLFVDMMGTEPPFSRRDGLQDGHESLQTCQQFMAASCGLHQSALQRDVAKAQHTYRSFAWCCGITCGWTVHDVCALACCAQLCAWKVLLHLAELSITKPGCVQSRATLGWTLNKGCETLFGVRTVPSLAGTGTSASESCAAAEQQ